jgi:acyl-CoA reductase-like NAD-dependent aldehyde dehydrogenase
VVAAIANGNLPLLPMAAVMAQVIAAGDTVICKPAQCVLGSLLLADLYQMLPPGVVNVITGGAEADRALAEHPEIAVTAVGATCWQPIIVLDDADLEIAVPGVAWERLRLSGQAASSKCVYVARSLAAEFADRIHEAMAFLEVGDPQRRDTDLGPLITREAARRVEDQIAHAAKEGARLKLGGRCFQPWGLPGHFFQPTILTDVRQGSAVEGAEIFGPVVLIIPISDAEEAIRACAPGRRVAASVYTRDPTIAKRTLQWVDGGAIWIDDSSSGTGASGRTGPQPPCGLFQHIATRKPWWFPYRERRSAVSNSMR